jgi:hypothetical protein
MQEKLFGRFYHHEAVMDVVRLRLHLGEIQFAGFRVEAINPVQFIGKRQRIPLVLSAGRGMVLMTQPLSGSTSIASSKKTCGWLNPFLNGLSFNRLSGVPDAGSIRRLWKPTDSRRVS